MNDYAERVRKNELEHSRLLDSCANLRTDYVEAASRFLSNWFEDTVRSTLSSQPETAKRLQPSELSALKSEVTALAASSRDIIARHVLNCGYWGNLAYPHGLLNDALRAAGGAIVPCLKKRGFRVQAEFRGDYHLIGGPMGGNPQMEAIKRRHDGLLNELLQNQQEKEDLKKQRPANAPSSLRQSLM